MPARARIEEVLRYLGIEDEELLRALRREGLFEAARGGEQRLSIARPTAAGGVREETVTVRIPPGVADGGRIRLRGKGVADPAGGPPGDLYVIVQIRVPSDLDAASKEKLAAIDGLEPKGLREEFG